jgi:RHS repeat-associated protein
MLIGDFFGMELLYNEGFSALSGTAQYNGNISGMKFKNSKDATQKGYGFVYDQLNRLTTSKYGDGTSYTSDLDRYDENMTYDKNGNILTLSRKGQTASGVFGDLDVLTYSYTGMGNQVRAIGDAVTDVTGRGDFFDGTDGNTNKEYYYDRNGNMWLDRNKMKKVVYNILNLPSQVIDTVTTTNKIEYVYTTAGQKLKKRLSSGTTTLYNGNFVYTLDGTANGIAVQYIITSEGRATNSSGTYTYEYHMKDHLGNTRISFNVPASTAVIVQQADYYPFGMIQNPQSTSNDNKYLYNGKELQDELDLDWYDYGARMYDPQIGRWMVKDILTESKPSITPYQYCYNNPLGFRDSFGLEGIYSTYVNSSGRVIWHVDDGDPRVYFVNNVNAWESGGRKKDGLPVVGFEDPDKVYKPGNQYTYYYPEIDPRYTEIISDYVEEYGYNDWLNSGVNSWADVIYGNPCLNKTRKDKLKLNDSFTILDLLILKATEGNGTLPICKPPNFNPAIEEAVEAGLTKLGAITEVLSRIFGVAATVNDINNASAAFNKGQDGQGIKYSVYAAADACLVLFKIHPIYVIVYTVINLSDQP